MSPSCINQLWPCQRGEIMAQQAPWQLYLKQLRSLISAPPDTYSELYLGTLYRFMELCQALPVVLNPPDLLEPYGLIQRAFSLAVAVLQVRRGQMLPSHSDSEKIAAQEAQWTYALLTVALFRAIPAHWQTAYRVGLYKNEQERLGTWHPLTGSLAELKTFYRIEVEKEESPSIEVDTSLLMTAWIGRLIPFQALRWLANSAPVFSVWWEAISQSSLLPDNNPLVKAIHEVAEKLGIILTKSLVVVASTPASTSSPERAIEIEIPVKSQQPIIPTAPAIPISTIPTPASPPSASRQALTRLSQWLDARAADPEDRPFLRIEKGLFIFEDALQRMMGQYTYYTSREALIQLLTEFLVQENGSFKVRYRSLNVERREIKQGVILAEIYLKDWLKALPICKDFSLDYSSMAT